MKTRQFVRMSDGWRMSAAAGDDEREGLASGVAGLGAVDGGLGAALHTELGEQS
jgi:hypothetical protein